MKKQNYLIVEMDGTTRTKTNLTDKDFDDADKTYQMIFKIKRNGFYQYIEKGLWEKV